MAKNKDHIETMTVLCRSDNVTRKFTLYTPKMEQDLLIEFGFVRIGKKDVWGYAENFGDRRGWVFTEVVKRATGKVSRAA